MNRKLKTEPKMETDKKHMKVNHTFTLSYLMF